MSNKSYSKIKICTKCHSYAEIINDTPNYLIILYNILLHQTRDGNGHCPLQVVNTKPVLATTQNLNYYIHPQPIVSFNFSHEYQPTKGFDDY